MILQTFIDQVKRVADKIEDDENIIEINPDPSIDAFIESLLDAIPLIAAIFGGYVIVSLFGG